MDVGAFLCGSTVECVCDNWDLIPTLASRHPRIPRKGDVFTIDRAEIYHGNDPLVPRQMLVVWLREIPGPPFDAGAFKPVRIPYKCLLVSKR